MTKRLTTYEFVARAKERHNGKYTYAKVEYITARTRVIVTCPTHGDFSVLPMNHLHSHGGCQKCAAPAMKFDINTWREQATIKYNGFYKYPPADYVNAYTKMPMVCPIHGPFNQTVYAHLILGHRCNPCGRKIGSEKTSKTRKGQAHEARATIKDVRLADRIKFLRNRLAAKGEVWTINAFGEDWI